MCQGEDYRSELAHRPVMEARPTHNIYGVESTRCPRHKDKVTRERLFPDKKS